MELNKDYYSILGINKNSSDIDIKKSYRKKANTTHPDKHGGDDSEFKEINEAYQTLGDKNKKAIYDSQSPYGKNYTNKFNFNDPFSSIFEHFFNFGRQNFNGFSTQEEFIEDLDIIANIDIDLKHIYNNDPITIKYNKQIKCPSCRGTGFDRNSESFKCEVCDGKGVDNFGFKCESCLGEGKIYSGTCNTCNGNKVINQEQEITLEKTYTIRKSSKNINRGYGHHSRYYRNKVGTLIVNINFIKNDKYDIDNYDLYYTKNIHFQDAIDGNKITHLHIDNSKIKLKLNKNTKDGDIIKIEKHGLLRDDNSRGDLYIKINIIIDYDKI